MKGLSHLVAVELLLTSMIVAPNAIPRSPFPLKIRHQKDGTEVKAQSGGVRVFHVKVREIDLWY